MALATSTGRYLKVNQQLCDMLVYTKKELLKKTFKEVTAEADRPNQEENLKKLLKKDIPIVETEKKYKQKKIN